MSDLKYIVRFDDGSHIMTDSIFDYALLNNDGCSISLINVFFKAWLVGIVIIMLFGLICLLMK
jgi:hypothetical protein